MHILCTMVAKSVNQIHRFKYDRCEGGYWDYADIGGRYDRIIPVSKNVTDLFEGINYPFNDDGYADNGFPFHTIENNLNLKYVSIARIRNIDAAEVARLEEHHLINPYHPYSFILEEEDGMQSEEYMVDEVGTGPLMDFINDPRHASYYVAVIDYHV